MPGVQGVMQADAALGLSPHAQQRQPLAVLAIGMQQTKVARAPKSLGQDMRQHQPKKMRCVDGSRRVLAGATVTILERDLAIRTAHDVTLLNHAPIQVAPQIDQCLVPIAHALAIDPPALGQADRRRQALGVQGRQRLAAKHRRQRLVLEQAGLDS